MGFLDPKPLTPGALDAAATALLNNPASDLAGELSATYAPAIVAAVANGADDATPIQQALTLAATNGGGTVVIPRRNSGVVNIGSTLVISSNTTLRLDAGVTLRRKTGFGGNLIQNASVAPLRTTTAASMTAASTTLTCATGAFTGADVGRAVSIAGAGSNVGTGSAKPLYTTIVSVTNSTTAVLAQAAVLTVASAALIVYGSRDSNITICGESGATIDGAANTILSGSTAAHHVLLRRIDGLRVYGLRSLNTAGKYAWNPGDVTNYEFRDLTFNVQSDGVHISGPAYNGKIATLRGYTWDDTVSLTPIDWAEFSDVSGPITVLDVEDIVTTSAQASLKITSSLEQGCYVERVTGRHIHMLSTGGNTHALSILNDCGTIDVRSVSLTDISGPSVATGAGTVGSLTLDNIRHTPQNTSVSALILANGVRVTNLVMRGASMALNAFSSSYLMATSGGVTVDRITVTSCEWRGSPLLNITNAADVITEADIDHIVLNGGSFVKANIVGATIGRVFLSNARLLDSSSLLDLAGTTDVYLHNVDAGAGISYRATSNVTVRGSGIKFGGSSKTAGAVVRSLTVSQPMDVGDLALNIGDQATNTNGSKSCGIGPVICTGTGAAPNWKNLATGATY